MGMLSRPGPLGFPLDHLLVGHEWPEEIRVFQKPSHGCPPALLRDGPWPMVSFEVSIPGLGSVLLSQSHGQGPSTPRVASGPAAAAAGSLLEMQGLGPPESASAWCQDARDCVYSTV